MRQESFESLSSQVAAALAKSPITDAQLRKNGN